MLLQWLVLASTLRSSHSILQENYSASFETPHLDAIRDGNHAYQNWYTSPHTSVSNRKQNVWVQVEFSGLKAFTSVTVWHFYGSTRQYYSQKIALSVTGAFNGEEVVVYDTGLGQLGPLETAAGNTITFKPIHAQYVRHWCGRSIYNSGVHFLEIAFIANDIAAPTGEPTGQPTVTARPTGIPTGEPSSIPSAMPSNVPSFEPSTVMPTVTPSVTPTATPTWMPTVTPTVTPSAIPTGFPSGIPSATPSSEPSDSPTIKCPNAFHVTHPGGGVNIKMVETEGKILARWTRRKECSSNFVVIELCYHSVSGSNTTCFSPEEHDEFANGRDSRYVGDVANITLTSSLPTGSGLYVLRVKDEEHRSSSGDSTPFYLNFDGFLVGNNDDDDGGGYEEYAWVFLMLLGVALCVIVYLTKSKLSLHKELSDERRSSEERRNNDDAPVEEESDIIPSAHPIYYAEARVSGDESTTSVQAYDRETINATAV